jgi:hypothetical protein
VFSVALTDRDHADELSLELELGLRKHLRQYGSLGQFARDFAASSPAAPVHH